MDFNIIAIQNKVMQHYFNIFQIDDKQQYSSF